MHELTLMKEIPFNIEVDDVLRKIGPEGFRGCSNELGSLIGEARESGLPRACFGSFEIEERGHDHVTIHGQRFSSRILSVSLEQTVRVALFVATCGRELERWSESYDDFLLHYLAEEICEHALKACRDAVQKKIYRFLGGGHRGQMNPGSLRDWPIEEQRALFRVLSKGVQAIGVELTESCLMVPRKSLSGIVFSRPEPFVNCRFCPRPICQGRRAAFDRGFFEEKFPDAKQSDLYGGPGVCGSEGNL